LLTAPRIGHLQSNLQRRAYNCGIWYQENDRSHTGEQALLCSLEERLLEPSVRSAADELTDWLADEFVEFGSSGRVYDKPPVIDALLA
jgi:uncharacterized protein DUF4440